MSYKEVIDPRSQFILVDKLLSELEKLMIVCCNNFLYVQKLQKRAYNKDVKPSRSYAPSKKVWLNNKYVKTKLNWKLKAQFFGPFQVLQLLRKQVYKLELPKKCRIYDVFYVSLLKQDITKIVCVEEIQLELNTGNSEKYKIEAIWDSAVYARELKGHLPGFYYLVLWKCYPRQKTPENHY